MAKSDGHGESPSEEMPKRRPPARTRRRRVQQLVGYAEELVEHRLINKTASPTEVVAVLRMGTESELANIERIKANTAYLNAQREKAEAETLRDSLFTDAMEAMSRYQGKYDD